MPGQSPNKQNLSTKLLDKRLMPDERWADYLTTVLNSMTRALDNILSGGLTIEQHMAGQVNEVRFLLDGDLSAFPLSFQWEYPRFRPRVCFIGQIDAVGGEPDGVGAAVTPRWRFVGDRIVVDSIRGSGSMTIDRIYTATFVTLA